MLSDLPPLTVRFSAPEPLQAGDALALLAKADGSVLRKISHLVDVPELPAYLVTRFEEIVGGGRVHTAGGGDNPLIVLQAPEPTEQNPNASEKVGKSLWRGIPAGLAQQIVVDATGLASEDAAHLAMGARLASYRFRRYRQPREREEETCGSLLIWSDQPDEAFTIYNRLAGLAEGVELARDLVNEPPNVLDPGGFVKRVQELKHLGLDVFIHDGAALEAMGANALLSVGRGSPNDCYLAELRWQGGEAGTPPIALVGKGITFDSGGISLKSADGLHEMKWDMGGAAAVVGTMVAIARQAIAVNVVAVLAIAENMPDGTSYRPGEIVRSLSGHTIEITNTDAEGRLALADALTHCLHAHDPAMIIDLATLTGAIMNALGDGYAGLFSTDAALLDRLRSAGEAEGERLWPMPLAEDYLELMRSPVADLRNAAERKGDALNAAIFLRQFVDDRPWAHIDMAATVWQRKPQLVQQAESGTGFGVRLLSRFLADWAQRTVSDNER